MNQATRRPGRDLAGQVLTWLWALSGAGEAGDERFLRGRLDGFGAVAGPGPGDGAAGRVAGQDRQAGQRRPGPAMTAQAANLDALPRSGPLQERRERLDDGFGAGRHAEVRPVEVAVVPGRLPAGVQVQAVIGVAVVLGTTMTRYPASSRTGTCLSQARPLSG